MGSTYVVNTVALSEIYTDIWSILNYWKPNLFLVTWPTFNKSGQNWATCLFFPYVAGSRSGFGTTTTGNRTKKQNKTNKKQHHPLPFPRILISYFNVVPQYCLPQNHSYSFILINHSNCHASTLLLIKPFIQIYLCANRSLQHKLSIMEMRHRVNIHV